MANLQGWMHGGLLVKTPTTIITMANLQGWMHGGLLVTTPTKA
ncbi:hypothetical protein [Mucilaginibacter sp. 14171R-50]|nr:hypothetical protein [Mucilaginibacter sp. 14171R-50]